MPDTEWSWDPSLFESSAPYYEQGRLRYVNTLRQEVVEFLGLDGNGRLLDVGCGPGNLAVELAPSFEEVVGIDADPTMIELARQRAARFGVANLDWRVMRAEELPSDLGTFRVATFGQSFHWMNRELVASAVRQMLEPGGHFVQITDIKQPAPTSFELKYPEPPYAAIRELVISRLGQVRRAGNSSLRKGTPSDEANVLAEAGFGPTQRRRIAGDGVVQRTSDDIVAWVFSRSDSAPHLWQDIADFESAVRAILAKVSPSGNFSEPHPGTEIIAWRRDG